MSVLTSIFVVGLGFLSGLWVAVGINPGAIFTSVLAGAADSLVPGPSLFVWLGALLCLGVSMAFGYHRRGLFGLTIVGAGFAGGSLILVTPFPAAVLLAVGLILGLFI
jgi:hypothetical protein